MSIGKTYKEAFQKAIRSLENGRYGLGFAKDFNKRSLSELMVLLREATSERQFIMYEALRKGASIDELYDLTHIKPWFIQQMKELVDLEEKILEYRGRMPTGRSSHRRQEGRLCRQISLQAPGRPGEGYPPGQSQFRHGGDMGAGSRERGGGSGLLLSPLIMDHR